MLVKDLIEQLQKLEPLATIKIECVENWYYEQCQSCGHYMGHRYQEDNKELHNISHIGNPGLFEVILR